jgi:hypothetical protein
MVHLAVKGISLTTTIVFETTLTLLPRATEANALSYQPSVAWSSPDNVLTATTK